MSSTSLHGNIAQNGCPLIIVAANNCTEGAEAISPTKEIKLLVCRVGQPPRVEPFDRCGVKINKIIGGLLDWDYACSGYDVDFSVPDVAFCYYDGSGRRKQNILGIRGNFIIARDMYHTMPSETFDGYLMGELTDEQLHDVLAAIEKNERVGLG